MNAYCSGNDVGGMGDDGGGGDGGGNGVGGDNGGNDGDGDDGGGGGVCGLSCQRKVELMLFSSLHVPWIHYRILQRRTAALGQSVQGTTSLLEEGSRISHRPISSSVQNYV